MHTNVNVPSTNVHLEMVKMVDLTLCVVYHSQKDSNKTLSSSPTLETFPSVFSLSGACTRLGHISVLKRQDVASLAYDFRNCRPAGMRPAKARGQIVPRAFFGKTAPTQRTCS